MSDRKNIFIEVSSKTNLIKEEEKILDFWNKRSIFKKSLEKNTDKDYIFYDGPPFATGLPHYGHLLAGTIKDIIPRYWTMKGFRVNRRFGWDCHGLPIENEAAKNLKEKENLDLSGRYEIEKYGIYKFNEYCRSIVLKYTAEWEKIVNRMGRWVDFENNYRTMNADFMESVWWVFKQLWDKGLIYKGYRVMPYSWKLSTPLSNFEAGENYQSVQDPSITVKFRLKPSEIFPKDTFFLAWTTTPWTLPSNLALAVGKDIEYFLLNIPIMGKSDKKEISENIILAKDRILEYKKLLKNENYRILGDFKGSELMNSEYEPLFPYFENRSFKIYHSDHVTTEDGTGIVHIAPAYGEEDFELAKDHNITIVDPVDAEGKFKDDVIDFKGMNVKDADPLIIQKLKKENKLFHQSTVTHNYPFCWRSNTPLIYKAISTWFLKVEPFREQMVKNNEKIFWVPEAIGKNRFGKWLKNAQDWNISRNRYWGTPIPLWQSDDGDTICIGSIEELEKLCKKKIDDIHSHKIDNLKIIKNGKRYKRIPEVFDCWFESGSMPYAQNHYPFENKELVEKNLPADFIAEGLDQTRGWFYTLTVLSTILFDRPAFKNVVVNGLILAKDGSKLSKSKKNFPSPTEIINKYGADVLRAYLINSPVVKAEPLKFNEDDIVLIYRKIVSPIWNSYSFFVTYALLDNYVPEGGLTGSLNILDRWIISKFQSLVKSVNLYMEKNYLYKVVPELGAFIDTLTNWYIRRSRRRFWKTEQSIDKKNAYDTLYYILTEFIKILAPFLPYISESIYQNLCRIYSDKPISVHLCDFPDPIIKLINNEVEEEMALVLQVVDLGRTLRAKHDLRIRQPLKNITIISEKDIKSSISHLEHIISDELNIK